MKIARFEHQGKIFWGSVHEEVVHLLTGDIFEGATETKEKVFLRDVKLLPPFVSGVALRSRRLNIGTKILTVPADVAPQDEIFRRVEKALREFAG